MTKEEAWEQLREVADTFEDLTSKSAGAKKRAEEQLHLAALAYAKACGMEHPKCERCYGHGRITPDGPEDRCHRCNGTGEEPKP